MKKIMISTIVTGMLLVLAGCCCEAEVGCGVDDPAVHATSCCNQPGCCKKGKDCSQTKADCPSAKKACPATTETK